MPSTFVCCQGTGICVLLQVCVACMLSADCCFNPAHASLLPCRPGNLCIVGGFHLKARNGCTCVHLPVHNAWMCLIISCLLPLHSICLLVCCTGSMLNDAFLLRPLWIEASECVRWPVCVWHGALKRLALMLVSEQGHLCASACACGLHTY